MALERSLIDQCAARFYTLRMAYMNQGRPDLWDAFLLHLHNVGSLRIRPHQKRLIGEFDPHPLSSSFSEDLPF